MAPPSRKRLLLRTAVAGNALSNLSVLARSQGEFARAAACSDEALRRYHGHGFDLAETAYGLQRTSPVAAQALGFNYAVQGTHRAQATSLLDKAQRMLGDNPVLAQARARLGEN